MSLCRILADTDKLRRGIYIVLFSAVCIIDKQDVRFFRKTGSCDRFVDTIAKSENRYEGSAPVIRYFSADRGEDTYNSIFPYKRLVNTLTVIKKLRLISDASCIPVADIKHPVADGKLYFIPDRILLLGIADKGRC